MRRTRPGPGEPHDDAGWTRRAGPVTIPDFAVMQASGRVAPERSLRYDGAR
jgi:hypothetical protein